MSLFSSLWDFADDSLGIGGTAEVRKVNRELRALIGQLTNINDQVDEFEFKSILSNAEKKGNHKTYELLSEFYTKLGLIEINQIVADSPTTDELVQKSLSKFERAIDLAPKYIYAKEGYALALYSISELYSDNRQEDFLIQSIDVCREILEYDRQLTRPLSYLAEGWLKLTEYSLGDDEVLKSRAQSTIYYYEFLFNAESPSAYQLSNLAKAYVYLGTVSEHKDKLVFFDNAIELFEDACSMKPTDQNVLASYAYALSTMGESSLGRQALSYYENSIFLYRELLNFRPYIGLDQGNEGRFLNLIIKIQPKERTVNYEFLVNHLSDMLQNSDSSSYGRLLMVLSKIKMAKYLSEKKRNDLINEITDRYLDCVNATDGLKSDYVRALVLYELSQISGGSRRLEFLSKSLIYAEKCYGSGSKDIDLITLLIDIKIDLADLGNDPIVKEGLIEEVISIIQDSIISEVHYVDLFILWGIALQKKALVAPENLRLGYLESAFIKFQKSYEYLPRNVKVFSLLGYNLGLQTLYTEEKLRRQKIDQAKQYYFKHRQTNPFEYYSLACFYSILNEKDKALKNLDLALLNYERVLEFVEYDDHWSHYRKESAFIKIIENHRRNLINQN